MESKKFFIAGVQHHHLSTVISDLSIGDEFELVPEPENKFDPNAVKIEFVGVMCGYVPRKFSSEVAAALETGADLVCEIVTLNPSAKPWEMCEVEVRSLREVEEEYEYETNEFFYEELGDDEDD